MQRRDIETVVDDGLGQPARAGQGVNLRDVTEGGRAQLALGPRDRTLVGRLGRDEVGASGGCPAQLLLMTPAGDLAVVATQQHLGHLAAAPGRRLGVDGVFEQAVLVGFLHERLRIPDHSGHEPGHGLDDGEHRHLTAVEHVIAEGNGGDLVGLTRLFQDPLVDALVAAAGEDEPLLGRPLGGLGLGERDSTGGRYQQPWPRPVRLVERRANRVERLAPGLGPHHHAGPTAVGGVVDGAMPVVGEIAQLVHANVEQPFAAGLADERELQRGQVVDEDRHHIYPHALSFSPQQGVIRHVAL